MSFTATPKMPGTKIGTDRCRSAIGIETQRIPKDRTAAERMRRYRARMRAAGIFDSYREARAREILRAYEAGDYATAGGLSQYPIRQARR